MRRGKWIGALVWLVTLGAAFAAGKNSTKTEPPAPVCTKASSPRRPVAFTTLVSERIAARNAREAELVSADSAPIGLRERATIPSADLSLDGVSDPIEAHRRAMGYVAMMLDGGPNDHLALFKTVDRVFAEMMAERSALSPEASRNNEQRMVQAIYPWLPFLMEREDRVIAALDSLYSAAAEDPQILSDLGRGTREIVTGLSLLLPAAADEATMARFRGYLERIQAFDPESDEQDLKDVANMWTAPETHAAKQREIVDQLNRGPLEVDQILSLLNQLDPIDLEQVDIRRVLGPIFETDPEQALQILNRLCYSARCGGLNSR